jgi:hypothetical protein
MRVGTDDAFWRRGGEAARVVPLMGNDAAIVQAMFAP